MGNKDYKQINLRDFRHNLTQLKDSLEAGQVYEVLSKGKPFAYFVPSQYKIKLEKKKTLNENSFQEAFKNAIGCVNVKNKEKFDYKKEYRKKLEAKYFK